MNLLVLLFPPFFYGFAWWRWSRNLRDHQRDWRFALSTSSLVLGSIATAVELLALLNFYQIVGTHGLLPPAALFPLFAFTTMPALVLSLFGSGEMRLIALTSSLATTGIWIYFVWSVHRLG